MKMENYPITSDDYKHSFKEQNYISKVMIPNELPVFKKTEVGGFSEDVNLNVRNVDQNLTRGVKRKLEQCEEENYLTVLEQNTFKTASINEIHNDILDINSNCSQITDIPSETQTSEILKTESKDTETHSTLSSSSSESKPGRRAYGLRPRSGHRKSWINEQIEIQPTEATASEEIVGRIDSTDSNAEEKELKPRLWSKGKSKNSRSKPLSKYRRITANARERDRMKEINTAFTALRGVLPTYTNSQINNMTKYSTLQLAVSYIKGLSDLLNETNNAVNESVKGESCSEESADTSNRDVNLSVGISEIKCGSVASTDCEQKPSDFLMFSKSSNFNFTHENIQGLEDFENLPEMRWAFDLMMD